MSSILRSSIGKKLIMSLSGFFLILFLTVHMSVNLVAVFSLDAYDAACEFMSTNPLIQIMVPVLAMGFVIHIVYAFILSWQNRQARGPVGYASGNDTKIGWASKNMLVLGLIVIGFLAVHLNHFWAKMQLLEWTGQESVKASVLLLEVFSKPLNVIIYILWILALCLHLVHGFWSAFQSIGLTNTSWNIRIKIICHSYVTLITAGFLTTVIYLYIKSLNF